MKRYLFLLLFSLLALPVFAQSPGDSIPVDNPNLSYLAHLTKIKIDSVRTSKGLKALKDDDILAKAAQDQADYLYAKNALSHFQADNQKKRTPQLRVKYYGGKNYAAGENVALTYLDTYMAEENAAEDDEGYTLRTFEEVANDLVSGWVHSEGHYANIVDEYYTLTSVAISYNPESKELRAVQVFALVQKGD